MRKFTLGLNAAKIIDFNNVSNKTCSELNFLQKSQWAHMSTPRVELGSSLQFQYIIIFQTWQFFEPPSSMTNSVHNSI